SAVLVGSVSTPSMITCDGRRVCPLSYVHSYAIPIADWTYTYTVDYDGALTAPANESSTVVCPADAVDPGAPADITDACDRPVSRSEERRVGKPCRTTWDGSGVRTYCNSDCDATLTAN